MVLVVVVVVVVVFVKLVMLGEGGVVEKAH